VTGSWKAGTGASRIMGLTVTGVIQPKSTFNACALMDPARFIAILSRLWAQRYRPFSTQGQRAFHLRLGRRGEQLAARFLRRQHGFKILYRNFRSKHGGEIDLVCRDRAANALVFVEVKTRRSDAFGPPHAAVTAAKQERLLRGARQWLRMLDRPEIIYRFDVVEVVMDDGPKITLIRNAFCVPDSVYY
jgi:putative endonuclease